jgi:hypothetical protein
VHSSRSATPYQLLQRVFSGQSQQAMAIPIAIFGKEAKISQSVREKLLPDFEG